MKKAVAYYRKSIEREAEKSIAGQKDVVREFAAENKIEIVQEFEEVGSSMTTERAELESLFQALKKDSGIDYVLVHRFDRITRDVMDIGFILGTLKQSGTKLLSSTEDNDYGDDPMKLLMMMMRTIGASLERQSIVDRMQEARRRKQARGGFLGGTPPFGYRSVPGSGFLEINEKEVPIVELVFELREKDISMRDIASELNKKGFTTRKGKQFAGTTVARILKHEDWYLGEGEAPAILGK